MPKVDVLFREGENVTKSVEVEIRSKTDFHCRPDDGSVTPEMVIRISDQLKLGMVCGHGDGFEWQR